jgi:hypothetical protein
VITGVDRVLRAGQKTSALDAIKVRDGLAKCAGVILRKSYQYVPIDTGALMRSGRVEDNGKPGMGARFAVVYGGTPEAYYAVYVHEDLTRAYRNPPRGAKFLERAVRETRGTCASIMRRTLYVERGKTIDGVREDITRGNPYTGERL